MSLRRFLSVLGIAGALLASGRGMAEPADEAKLHFQAGVQAFNEQRLADALSEFERAYGLKPTWQVLYNLGTVYAALGRPVEAIDALERYRSEGGRRIAADRLREVEAELERQKKKLSQLEVTVDQPGALVHIDARFAGKSPLKPVRVAAGSHVVEVSLDGYAAQRRPIVVKAQEQLVVPFTLVALEVPAIAPAPAPPAAAPAPPTVARSCPSCPPAATCPDPGCPSCGGVGGTQRAIGGVFGALGLAGLSVGIVLVTVGQSKHQEAEQAARAGNAAQAESLEAEADRRRNVAFGFMGVGAAVTAGGLLIILTAPRRSDALAKVQLSPWASASSRGMAVSGSW